MADTFTIVLKALKKADEDLRNGNYNESFKEYEYWTGFLTNLKVNDLNRTQDYEQKISKLLIKQGIIFALLKNFKMSIKYFKKSFKMSQNPKEKYYSLYLFIKFLYAFTKANTNKLINLAYHLTGFRIPPFSRPQELFHVHSFLYMLRIFVPGELHVILQVYLDSKMLCDEDKKKMDDLFERIIKKHSNIFVQYKSPDDLSQKFSKAFKDIKETFESFNKDYQGAHSLCNLIKKWAKDLSSAFHYLKFITVSKIIEKFIEIFYKRLEPFLFYGMAILCIHKRSDEI